MHNKDNNKLKNFIQGLRPVISAASIVAKVYRDSLMIKLSEKFSNYAWESNFGYGTKQHLKAIKKLGISKHHRKTFSPINNYKTHNI